MPSPVPEPPDNLPPGISLNESLEPRTLVTRFPNADPTNKGQKGVDFTQGSIKKTSFILDPKTGILTVKEVRTGGEWIQNKLLNPINETTGALDLEGLGSRVNNNVQTAIEKFDSQLRMPRANTRWSSNGDRYSLELERPDRLLIHLEIPGINKLSPKTRSAIVAAANEQATAYDLEGLPVRVEINEPPLDGVWKPQGEPVSDRALGRVSGLRTVGLIGASVAMGLALNKLYEWMQQKFQEREIERITTEIQSRVDALAPEVAELQLSTDAKIYAQITITTETGNVLDPAGPYEYVPHYEPLPPRLTVDSVTVDTEYKAPTSTRRHQYPTLSDITTHYTFETLSYSVQVRPFTKVQLKQYLVSQIAREEDTVRNVSSTIQQQLESQRRRDVLIRKLQKLDLWNDRSTQTGTSRRLPSSAPHQCPSSAESCINSAAK
jgi:hypothetical protein